MNKQTFDAIVNWIPNMRKSGVPFKNKKYAPLIEINGQKVFNDSAWSVICYSYEFICVNVTKAYVRFLNVESAPDILSLGTEFSLFEGFKKVAFGKIIDKSDYDLNP